MRRKTFNDEVFLTDVVAITGTREETQAFLDKNDIEFDLGGDGYCGAFPNNRGFVVWLLHPDDFYVLMHEVLHLVVYIFNTKGININLANEEEVIAYYQSFWFRKLWRWFGGLKKK